jgi:hypothetical protein
MSSLCPFIAHATDSRIKSETYDRTRVYDIYFKSGRAALIQLESDEILTDKTKATIGMGDKEAWNLGARGNNIVLKPAGKQPETNLVIATNKRIYAFDLKNASDLGQVTYILKFSYPDTATAKTGSDQQVAQVTAVAKALTVLSATTIPDTSAAPVAETIISPSPQMPDAITLVASPVAHFVVNANDKSMMEVLNRWTRTEKIDFSWLADIDYPLNNRMRAIESPTLPIAVAEMRATLRNARVPLEFSLDEKRLNVSKKELVEYSVQSFPAQSANQFSNRHSVPDSDDKRSQASTAAATPSRVERPWDSAARFASGAFTMHWNVGEKTSLRGIVEAWGKTAGIRIQWESTSDYALNDAVRTGQYSGTFKEALGQLASRFGEFAKPLGMKFISNGTVLRIYDIQPA